MTVFFDSNVLVYRVDYKEPGKRDIASRLIDESLGRDEAMISTQSLQEFYNAATRRIGLPAREAKLVAEYYGSAHVIQVTPGLIFSAMDRHGVGGFSFWDALIVEAALAGGARVLYSEDMQDGMRVGDLVIRNPFAAV